MTDPQTTGSGVPTAPRDWESRFREKPQEWFFGREPSEQARLTYHYWKLAKGDAPARVLDLGCGEGRDSVYYTGKGFQCTSVDGSQFALDKAKLLASEFKVTLSDLRCMNVRDFPFDPSYDLVHAHNVLQFLGADCLPTLRRIQEATPPGGFNSIAVFTREADALRNQPDLYAFDHNELKFHYAGWRLTFYAEELLWREPSQRHLSFARIIAQKPGGPNE
jgi:tellurite methyltransferase